MLRETSVKQAWTGRDAFAQHVRDIDTVLTCSWRPSSLLGRSPLHGDTGLGMESVLGIAPRTFS